MGAVVACMAVGGGLAPAGAHASGLSVVAPAAATTSSVTSPATTAPVAGAFTSLAPARVLDTRSNLGGPGPVASGGVVHLHVLGRGGVPASGVSAVVLNVTVVYPKAPGFVTVWPDGAARPTASNLNFVAGQTVANLVVAKVGTDGAVSLANSSGGTIQLVADVAGYYLAGTPSAAGAFASLAPARVLDTRSNLGAPGPVASGGVVHLPVLGRGGVPASGVSAVVLNVTVVYPKAPGFVTVWPDGDARPTASNLNFVAGQTVANLVVAKVGADGAVSLANSSGGTIHMVADVAGYYLAGRPAAAGAFSSLAPARVLDTRSNLGAPGPVASGGVVHLRVLGQGGVPASGASAVVLNVTVVYPKAPGFVTVWPDGAARPTASNLNFVAGQTVANLVVAKVGTDGSVSLANSSAGTIQLVADVAGYYLNGLPQPVSAAKAVTASSTSMTLSWTNPLAGPFTGVVIRRATGTTPPATATDGTAVASTTGSVATFTDPALAAGDTYSYALFATDGTTYGPPATMTVTAGLLSWGTPRTIDPNAGQPSALSCASPTFCVAVDQAGDALTSDGTTWSAPTRVDPKGGLDSVSCPTATFCAAVDTGPFGGSVFMFDGSTWTGPAASDGAGLYSVSCASASFCVAVDWAGRALTFNGTAWSSPTLIETGSLPGGDLRSVSCPSASFCVAVDTDGRQLTFDGVAWSTRVTIDSVSLSAVSCSSASFCAAVDSKGNALTFDGTAWSAPVPIDGRRLGRVSCPATSSCRAVDDLGRVLTLTGSSWSAPVMPDYAGHFVQISCPTVSSCTAVDDAGEAVTYDGTTWSGPSSIDPYRGRLTGVSCPSVAFCVAVDDGGSALTYDGSAWSAPTKIGSRLRSVSCPSATFCAAVDGRGNALTFDGTSWSAPIPVLNPGDLFSVSCPSASFCAATDTSGRAVTFDGAGWSAPTDIDGSAPVMSVSCPSATFCAAVDTSGHVMTFDGQTWGAPQPIDVLANLVSVSCASAAFCVAGDYGGNVLTMEGSSWSAPHRITSTTITSVSCPTSSSCNAVDTTGHVTAFNGSTWSPTGVIPAQAPTLSCPSARFCALVEMGRSAAALGVMP